MAIDVAAGVQDALRNIGINVTVESAQRLTAGASRETFAISGIADDGSARRLILRRDPPGHGDAGRMRAEAACLRSARSAGVPVPQLLCSGDAAPGIDAPFLIMQYIEGETLPHRIHRHPDLTEVRPQLATEFGRVLARIHATPTSGLEMLDATDPIDALEAIFRGIGQANPTAEVGFRWLRAHSVPDRPMSLVHGDFRVGNLIVSPDGLAAVLDWELAHLGNPIEDLGWLCVPAWRFGVDAPVGGFGERGDLLDGYEAVSGIRPSDDELYWWEVYGTLRWLVLSLFQANRHFSGAEHSLELAAIGRRVSEFEYDLLTTLHLTDSVTPQQEFMSAAPESVFNRPSLAEILTLAAEAIDTAGNALADRQHERHQLRIAANLLRIADREVRDQGSVDSAIADALASIGCDSEADLAQRIRSGEFDAVEATSDRRAVATIVAARLRVDGPRQLSAQRTKSDVASQG